MTRYLIGLIIILLSSPALAGPVTLRWDVSSTATGYEVEQSLDNGSSWTKVVDLTTSVCTATACTHTLTAPVTGQVLYRFVSKNAVGRSTRYDAGTWYCESCKPPSSAANVGIQ